MADNLTLQTTAATPPANTVLATDDVAGVHYPVGKLAFGAADSATLVSSSAGLPVAVVAGSANIGDVDVLSIAAGDNNIGNVDVVSLPAIPAGDNNIGDVDVASVPAPLSTTGGGTEATALRVTLASDSTGLISVDDNGGSLTIDDGGSTITVDGTVGVSGTVAVSGTVTANLAAGTNNIGDVDVLSVPAPLNVAGGGTEAAAQRVTIASDSTGVLSVVDNGASLTVDGTVAATQSGTWNIGTVTTVSAVTTATVTQATAANLNTTAVGPIAHDIGVSGNPQVFAGVAQDSDDTAPPNRVSAEADVTRLASDRDGSLHVLPFGPQIWSKHLDGSAAYTDTVVHASPGVGLSLYVGTIVVSTGAATEMNVFFEEGATKVLGPYYLEATAGRGFAIQFNPPKKITANTALTYTSSASIAQSLDVTGYTAQG